MANTTSNGIKKGLKYNPLGETGMNVSEYGFGASGFSSFFGETGEADCIETVKVALDLGINYIDSAPWYGHGTSETILGKVRGNIYRICKPKFSRTSYKTCMLMRLIFVKFQFLLISFQIVLNSFFNNI